MPSWRSRSRASKATENRRGQEKRAGIFVQIASACFPIAMSDKSYLDWPFFENGTASSSASSTPGRPPISAHRPRSDVDAACRDARRASSARAAGCATRSAAPPMAAFPTLIDTRCDLPDPRDAGAPFRPRRFRLRHAGPGLGRDHPRTARRSRSARYLPRAARGEAIAAFALSEPRRRLRRGGDATAPPARTATPMCSTARRPGSPTAASPISTSCSRAPARARGAAASPPSSSMPASRDSTSPSAST